MSGVEPKIWTAAELEEMTPAELREISRTAEITDIAQFPEMLERARESIARYEMRRDRRRSWPADAITSLDRDEFGALMRLVRTRSYDDIDRMLGQK